MEYELPSESEELSAESLKSFLLESLHRYFKNEKIKIFENLKNETSEKFVSAFNLLPPLIQTIVLSRMNGTTIEVLVRELGIKKNIILRDCRSAYLGMAYNIANENQTILNKLRQRVEGRMKNRLNNESVEG